MKPTALLSPALLLPFFLLPAELLAQMDPRSRTTLRLSGQTRSSAPLYLAPDSGVEMLNTEPTDPLTRSPRRVGGEGGRVALRAPFRFNEGRSGFSVSAAYRAVDLKFDEAPFRGREPGSRDWLFRELLIEADIFETSDFSDYEHPAHHDHLHLPGTVPFDGFEWEDLAERRKDQFLLDSTGLPILSEVYHVPVDRKNFYLNQAELFLEADHRLNDSIFVFGSIIPTAGWEAGAKARAETSFMAGGLGLGYSNSENFSTGIGVFYTDTFGREEALPLFFVHWKPVDWWELELNLPVKAASKFWFNSHSNLSFGVELNLGAAGLREEKNQIFTTGADAFVAGELFVGDGLIVELKGGVNVFRDYSLQRRGKTLYRYGGPGGGFAQLAVTIGLDAPKS